MIGELYSFAFEQASDEEKEELKKESENAYEMAWQLSKPMSHLSLLKLSIADAYSYELINSFGKPNAGRQMVKNAIQQVHLALSKKSDFDQVHINRVKAIVNGNLK